MSHDQNAVLPPSAASDLTLRTALLVILLFCLVVLAFTAAGVVSAPSAEQIGITRPLGSIPPHLAELAGFGLMLGGASALVYGRKGIPLVILVPVLTVSLDLDHLPAYLGFAQPIRPAHSFVFIAVMLVIMATTIKRPEFELVTLSAVLGHLGIDTGLFPPFSPLSFYYASLDPYRIAFLIGAGGAALAAGYLLRREASPATTIGGVSIV